MKGHVIRFGVYKGEKRPQTNIRMSSAVAKAAGFVKGPNGEKPRAILAVGSDIDAGKLQLSVARPGDEGSIYCDVLPNGTASLSTTRVPLTNDTIQMTDAGDVQIARDGTITFEVPRVAHYADPQYQMTTRSRWQR